MIFILKLDNICVKKLVCIENVEITNQAYAFFVQLHTTIENVLIELKNPDFWNSAYQIIRVFC